MAFAAWLETTAIGTWVRESPSLLAFPFILIVHAWGMGFLAGGNLAVNLRVLGLVPRVPLNAMAKFYPVMWFGFIINLISGVLLLLGYPTKALTNPVFYLKLSCVTVGMVLMWWLKTRVVTKQQSDTTGKLAAAASLVMWAVAVIAGRFLAYTCTWLMAGTRC
jgi:hypothetical protein